MPAFSGAPHACLCGRVRAAARRLTALYETHLAEHGLTLPQFGLMATIAAAGEAPIAHLAAKTELDPSTLSRTLQPLQAAALIEINTDPENRRLRVVRLTRAGRRKVKDAGRAWMKAQKIAQSKIDETLIAALHAQTGEL